MAKHKNPTHLTFLTPTPRNDAEPLEYIEGTELQIQGFTIIILIVTQRSGAQSLRKSLRSCARFAPDLRDFLRARSPARWDPLSLYIIGLLHKMLQNSFPYPPYPHPLKCLIQITNSYRPPHISYSIVKPLTPPLPLYPLRYSHHAPTYDPKKLPTEKLQNTKSRLKASTTVPPTPLAYPSEASA